jgi:hypothetical protein
MQGVRQLGPSEVLASAPGGSDSIVSETLAPLVMLLGRKFQLGVPDAQPETSKALVTAQTRINSVIALYVPAPPRPRGDHKGRAIGPQPEPKLRGLGRDCRI